LRRRGIALETRRALVRRIALKARVPTKTWIQRKTWVRRKAWIRTAWIRRKKAWIWTEVTVGRGVTIELSVLRGFVKILFPL
jgi:hypothetical protein